jgi:hypothetical protein
MTWEPMTPDEAREVLSSEPPESPAELRRWSDRYVEAWMVEVGAAPERIKAAMEQLRRNPLD